MRRGLILYVSTLAAAAGLCGPATAPPRECIPVPVGHAISIDRLAFSPDGTVLATAAPDGSVRLWSTATWALERVLQWDAVTISGLCFSHDGEMLLAGGSMPQVGRAPDPGGVRLWHWRTGTTRLDLRLDAPPGAPILSRDGGTLACGVGRDVALWDLRTGRRRALLRGHTRPVGALAFSPDGKRLASASGKWPVPELDETDAAGEAILWEPAAGKQVALLRGYEQAILAVAFSPDGRTLATGGMDRTARLWDGRTGAPRRVLKHTGPVADVAFSADGAMLITGSRDGTVARWRVADGVRQQVLVASGEASTLGRFAFSRNGKRLVTDDRCWNSTTWRPLAPLDRPAWEYGAAPALSPKGSRVATTFGSTAFVCDADTGRLEATLLGHSGAPNTLAFSPDGTRIATGENRRDERLPGIVRLWDAATGEPAAILECPVDGAGSLAYSPDGKLLAAWGPGQTARLWDAATGAVQADLAGHPNGVLGLAFSPDGSIVATSGSRGQRGARDPEGVCLWDARTGKLLARLDGNSLLLPGAFSADGKLLVTTSPAGENALRLWDVPSGRLAATLGGSERPPYLVAFSPDGRTLVSAHREDAVRLWDVPTRRCRAVLAHTTRPRDVFFSRDGRLLALHTPADGVRLCDGRTGELRHIIAPGHVVLEPCFSPSGALLTGVTGFRLTLWDTATGKVARTLGDGSGLRPVLFSPDGGTLAGVGRSDPYTACLWDVVSGERKAVLRGHTGWAFEPRFAPPGVAYAVPDPLAPAMPATRRPAP